MNIKRETLPLPDLEARYGHLPNPIHTWDDDEDFQKLYQEAVNNTLVDIQRCYMLYQFVMQVRAVSGSIAEIGVFKGGTAKLISKCAGMDKRVFLFDTFEGMPETDPSRDRHRRGDFADTSLEAVSKFLADCKNVSLHQGFFPETSGPIVDKTFSFVHVDVDIYKSVVDCCEFFYNRLEIGGVMVFDDYGFRSCPGAKLAVDEFFADKDEHPHYLPTGQSFIFKL